LNFGDHLDLDYLTRSALTKVSALGVLTFFSASINLPMSYFLFTVLWRTISAGGSLAVVWCLIIPVANQHDIIRLSQV